MCSRKYALGRILRLSPVEFAVGGSSGCVKAGRGYSQRSLIIGILLLCQILNFASALVMTGTITFQNFGPYEQGRIGVRSCVQDYGGNGNLGDLVGALGCGSPYYDSCVCRSDLAITGSYFLTKCINSLCTSNPVDLSQGLLIWDAYCSRTTFTSINTHTMSIAFDSGYQSARPCARSCIQDYGGNGIWGDVPGNLQCPRPWFDSCLCRNDLVTQGVSFLMNCVTTQCQNSVDVTQAVMEYLHYCGYTTSAAGSGSGVTAALGSTSVSASTTVFGDASTVITLVSAANTPTTFIPVKTTALGSAPNTASLTGTPSASSSNTAGGGWSLSDKIAVEIGLGLGIPTLLVTILMCLKQFTS